jgi:hypothetical protein
MKPHVLGFSILIITAIGNGQITSGKVDMKINQGVQFGGGGSAFDIQDSGGTTPFDTKNNFKNADFIMATMLCLPCNSCYCCTWEFGSSRPYWVSKKHIDSTDFSQVLVLNDTSKFKKVDSLKSASGSQLPHSVDVPMNGNYFVISNIDNRYVLLTLSETTRYIPNYSNPTIQCVNGAKINWWVQTNGKPHFPNPTSLVKVNSQKKQFIELFDYQINGRRNSIPPK